MAKGEVMRLQSLQLHFASGTENLFVLPYLSLPKLRVGFRLKVPFYSRALLSTVARPKRIHLPSARRVGFASCVASSAMTLLRGAQAHETVDLGPSGTPEGKRATPDNVATHRDVEDSKQEDTRQLRPTERAALKRAEKERREYERRFRW